MCGVTRRGTVCVMAVLRKGGIWFPFLVALTRSLTKRGEVLAWSSTVKVQSTMVEEEGLQEHDEGGYCHHSQEADKGWEVGLC